MGVVPCGTRDDGAALTRFGVLLALTVVATYRLGSERRSSPTVSG